MNDDDIDDDMVTIPELRVSRAELAAWQRTNNGMRQAWEKTLDRCLPVPRVRARYGLHLLNVDTTRPFEVGDQVRVSKDAGGWVVKAVDDEWLALVHPMLRSWVEARRCTLDEEAGR